MNTRETLRESREVIEYLERKEKEAQDKWKAFAVSLIFAVGITAFVVIGLLLQANR